METLGGNYFLLGENWKVSVTSRSLPLLVQPKINLRHCHRLIRDG